ncbi:hypothetical protein BUALT_Bualt14G0119600 [Buddleja alternifolia]|uniref:Uncharacterized protein n=1 Tax=Buddleja alternifolia TaxID=168488 RepID=A0AAV6WK37_9LAMI|nr:hypothetical protein BUALT_Bualt14G0119600 [Buddleja alternifolia]
MEITVISDAISSIAYSTQSLSFSNFIINRPHSVLSISDASLDQPPQSPPPFNISAASPPPTRTLTKPRIRKNRRVKRKIVIDNFGDESGLFVFGDGGGFGSGDGYFGGGGGGGKGWNFGGYGGDNWEEFSDNSISDPAFDFVYEVLCWIAMSNCLHFAFKRVARRVSEGFGDQGKAPMQLPPVC